MKEQSWRLDTIFKENCYQFNHIKNSELNQAIATGVIFLIFTTSLKISKFEVTFMV